MYWHLVFYDVTVLDQQPLREPPFLHYTSIPCHTKTQITNFSILHEELLHVYYMFTSILPWNDSQSMRYGSQEQHLMFISAFIIYIYTHSCSHSYILLNICLLCMCAFVSSPSEISDTERPIEMPFHRCFRASSCELHKLYDIHRKNEQIGQRWFFSLFSVCFVDVIFPMCKAASFM